MRLFEMTSAQIDRAVEAHWDRVWERMNEPDAWEHDDPDWTDIEDIVSNYWQPGDIANAVRDYIEDNPDLLSDVSMVAALDGYIAPEDRWMLKDPDTAYRLVDGIIDAEWHNDDLMRVVWAWLPDDHREKLVTGLMQDADSNGLRDKYNDLRRE